jgi:hypothetical protein
MYELKYWPRELDLATRRTILLISHTINSQLGETAAQS